MHNIGNSHFTFLPPAAVCHNLEDGGGTTAIYCRVWLLVVVVVPGPQYTYRYCW